MRILPGTLRIGCGVAAVGAFVCSAQIQQSWSRLYFGEGLGQTIPVALATGVSGEVYVAGHAYLAGFDQTYATLRYDAAGSNLWSRYFNATAGDADFPVAIAVGPDGSVVVTGRSGRFDLADFATIKYSSTGTQIWARACSVSTNSVEHPAAIAIDALGNVCVTGTTVRPGSHSDVITVCYSADGSPKWTNIFTGFGNHSESAAGMAVDLQGNVYVTGTSETTTASDYAAIKYNNQGVQLWAVRYDGPLHQHDSARALMVDSLGNVYVAGISLGRGPGMIARFEFTTVKYDPNGARLWAARRGFPGYESVEVRGIAFDGTYILVLGSIFGSSDSESVLIKYAPAGNELWTARHNGSPLAYDAAQYLALDASGSAYVAGVSAVAADWHVTLLKYDSSGNRLWKSAYVAPSPYDNPVGLAVASASNIFLAVHTHDPQNGDGFLTIKYAQTPAPSGAPEITVQPVDQRVPAGSNVVFTVTAAGNGPLAYQWRYNGLILPFATNSSLVLSDVRFDQTGDYSVEVTNQFGAVATPEARLVVLTPPIITTQPKDQLVFAGAEAVFSVSATGTEPFSYQWFRNDFPVSGGGDSLLTIRSAQSTDAGNYTLVVSNDSGAITSAVARLTVSDQIRQEWTDVYDGPGAATDVNPLVKVDGFGNVYLAGTSAGSPSDSDFVIIKYDSSGNRLWTARYSAESNSVDTVYAMAVDSAGNVWVTGATDIPETERDALTVRYSSSGQLLWAARFGTTNLIESTLTIALDDSSNAYVAGQNGEDFLIIKHGPGGSQQWAVTVDGPGNGMDSARSIAVHGANVYVTGTAWNGSNQDFLTVKYNTNGTPGWTVSYDAAGTDSAVAVAVDPLGNVLVTGNSYGTINYDEFGSDYVIVKYNSDGIRQWSARYDGYLNSEDYPSALVVDAAGNIYVTGHSDFESDDSGIRQFATLKYDPDGRQLWRAWHISSQYDGSRSLAVDDAGNVYITTLLAAPLSGRNIGFIKYDAQGNRLLTAQYNGPDNSDDKPSALAIDGLGNVYVAGSSSGISGTGEDFVLLKYSQKAVPGLPAILTPPASQVLASGSNAVFSVAADGDAPLRYQWQFNSEDLDGATGPILLLAQVDTGVGGNYSVRVSNAKGTVISPEATLDVQNPPAILVQPLAQTAIPGSSVSFTVTAEGSEPLNYQWSFQGVPMTNATQRIFTVTDIQPANAGDYEVEVRNQVGFARSAPARLLVTHVAQQSWAARYNGPAGDSIDSAVAIAAGSDGAVYVTGRSSGPGTGFDIATVKYDPAGQELWAARYDGPGNDFDRPTDLAVDEAGNVYVTGYSWGSKTREDIVIIKYDSSGNQLWVARYDGADHQDDQGHAIVVDGQGNVYVTGSTISLTGAYNQDVVTIKYNAAGAQLWAVRYDGPVSGFDTASDVGVDAAGNLYVTGASVRNGMHPDMLAIKYTGAGLPVWTNHYNGPGNAYDSAVRLCLDSGGNIYLGGDSDDANGFPDFALLKYAPSGELLWEARYDGRDHFADYLFDLAVDPGGNAYVTGTSHSFITGTDYATLKFSPGGVRLWLARYDGPNHGADNALAMALDSNARIYVTGTSQTAPDFDATTLCYDAQGNRRWFARYTNPVDGSDAGAAIAADSAGNVFVTGGSFGPSAEDFITIKYTPGVVPNAPAILVPPPRRLGVIGESVSFSVAAAGEGPLYYIWRRNSAIVSEGFNASELLLYDINVGSAGYYTVEVLNRLGSVLSPVAELDIDGPAVPRIAFAEIVDGAIQLRVIGQIGYGFRLDRSLDLIDWAPVATNYNQTSSIEFIDPLAAGPRFYRAVKLPSQER
ncbi:MAG: SBBP repeat-containing protein [Verrucomicrobia subdivision 3 bacterium]|nr:SBBP repeat-containing protein [Limisphaerales bacterium]